MRTVTWTSQDGLTWSQPTQTTDSEITALAAAGDRRHRHLRARRNPPVVAFPAP